ncbi:hypothetical protein AXK12_03800 [Cephaloticoccus capnophilus]|uniref:Uncharacterized protein n=2 Tax=Cephaloticoccus capnophilus TaxID=1548208 RepID=A0A139SNV3_9BACT|nr:hypothetical protein AXK12_03800 [Cephaloticoccus capnophilus]
MKGAAVYIDKNDQIADHARVSLISYEKASKLNFSAHIKEQLQETFRELFVEGKGAIDFGSGDRHSEHGRRLLYIDDLIIGDGSTLRIHGWRDKRDYILVRKNSVHLEDALKKIEFKGYDRNNIHLENYNNAYWVISATPESATYGSLLVASTVPLSLLRRRIKACLGRSPS